MTKLTEMKHLTTCIISLFLLLNIAVAQTNITIRGTVDDAEGKMVELYKYADKISNLEMLVDTCRISPEHFFEVKCYANTPVLVAIQIENYSQSFFVEPGRTYDVVVEDFDWNIDEQKNIFLDPVTLPVQFVGLPKDDVNYLIGKFEGVVSKYIMDHRAVMDMRYRPKKQYFDSLVMEVNRYCPDIEGNDFFNRYKRYNLAKMRLEMRLGSRKSVFEQFIKDQYVLAYDDNYMTLFSALYANSISLGSRYIKQPRLAYWIENLEYAVFVDSLGVDPFLRHEQIRELAALQALGECYYNSLYKQDKVVAMIKLIAQRTKFSQHQVVADNLLKSLRRQQTEAVDTMPLGELPDVEKKMFSLDSLKGHWVYIAFVRADDPNCMGEIETMAHFKDTIYKMSDSIDFVTIVCDREFQKMYHLLMNTKKGSRYDWTWLHYNGNFDLLRRFEVCSYPWFVLLDPDGKPYYNITPAPSTGIFLDAPWNPKNQPKIQEREVYKHTQRK